MRDRAAHDEAYRERNREAIRARNAAWKKDNRDTVNASQQRRRHATNPPLVESVEERERRDALNAEKNRARVKAWQRANPEKVKAQKALRRARLRGCEGTILSREEIAERDEWTCHLCGGEVTRDDWSLDHLTPISQGGPHTSANVKLAHHLCNARRGAKPLAEAA